MGSFGGLEIGLSFLFAVIFLVLVAELYYFLWWKRRLSHGKIDDESNKYAPLLSYFFCWKTPIFIANSNSTRELNPTVSRNRETEEPEQDLELGNSKDSLLKSLGEENVDMELMRLHNLWGPPRFLCTIKEETKEDLESEDAKSRGDRSRKGSRTRSLSDVIIAVDTPFLSPLSSPSIKASPLNGYNHRGFNPLFESFTEADLTRLRASPPPKFKFLRDAEEKLIKRLVEEAERRAIKKGVSVQESGLKSSQNSEVKEGSLISFMNKNMERDIQQHEDKVHPSGHSKVLPLASSPSKISPVNSKSSLPQDILILK